MTEEVIQEFISNFNKDFRSNISSDVYAFLKDLYECCVVPEITNEFDKQCMIELEQIVDELYKSFNKQQRDLFDRFDKLKDKMYVDVEQQLFIYGFCISKMLDKIGELI